MEEPVFDDFWCYRRIGWDKADKWWSAQLPRGNFSLTSHCSLPGEHGATIAMETPFTQIRLPTAHLEEFKWCVRNLEWCGYLTVPGSWYIAAQRACSDFEHKVWSWFWSWGSGEILKLKFDQYFASDVWLRLQSWILVNILRLGLELNPPGPLCLWQWLFYILYLVAHRLFFF